MSQRGCLDCPNYIEPHTICRECYSTQHKCTNCNTCLKLMDDPFCGVCGACVPFRLRPWSNNKGVWSGDYCEEVRNDIIKSNKRRNRRIRRNRSPPRSHTRIACGKCNSYDHREYECTYCDICKDAACDRVSCVCIMCGESGTNKNHASGKCCYSPCTCEDDADHILRNCPNKGVAIEMPVYDGGSWASFAVGVWGA